MHPETTVVLARQRLAEHVRQAELARRRRAVPRPVTVRVRAGRILVRWGTRLARPAPAPTPYHPASMSA